MANLIDKLPQFYRNSAEMVAMQSYLQVLIDALWRDRGALGEQLCIDTATWGLATWESALGISTDASKNISFRRERIKAKLRGSGTTTKTLIRHVAESFSNGEVDVIEYPSEYRIVIKFTGTIGIPPNMQDLTQSLREVMPAHLQWEYEYIFNIWQNIAPFTWGDVASHTWKGVSEDDFT